MARQKRSSRVLDKAKRRLSGVRSINENLQINQRLTAQNYSNYVNHLNEKLSAYNQALSDMDALRSEVDEAEDFLAKFSEQMLLGIAAEFGKDSIEYEKAGGIRNRDRKRPVRKVVAAAAD
jgi:uncharacterized phage infection (PIP) family protein YhgE